VRISLRSGFGPDAPLPRSGSAFSSLGVAGGGSGAGEARMGGGGAGAGAVSEDEESEAIDVALALKAALPSESSLVGRDAVRSMVDHMSTAERESLGVEVRVLSLSYIHIYNPRWLIFPRVVLPPSPR
jgi:hypothetical protein